MRRPSGWLSSGFVRRSRVPMLLSKSGCCVSLDSPPEFQDCTLSGKTVLVAKPVASYVFGPSTQEVS